MSRLYNIAGQGFLQQLINWDTDDTRIVIVADTYTFDPAHTTGSDLGGADIGTPQQIPTPIATFDGITAGGSVAFSNLSDPRSAAYVVIVQWNTTLLDSKLLAYYDTVTGMPFTPNGGDYAIFPDATLGGFFQIGGVSC